MTERWRTMSGAQRRLTVVGLVVAGWAALLWSLQALGASPGGPSLSSYATDAHGLAAYEELLARSGHAPSRLRVPLDEARLASDVTIVALGQSFDGPERESLRRFLESGGRAVVGGSEALDVVRAFADAPVQWRTGGGSVTRVEPVEQLAGLRVVRGEGFGVWEHHVGVALLRRGERVTAIALPVGAGQLIALADPSPLTNAWLDRADNAGFGVAVAGDAGRRVTFAEHGHGYGVADGLAALPARWKAAIGAAAAAAVAGAAAAGKRFGPTDPVPLTEAPPRVRYVEAVASTLARTRDRAGAIAPLRQRATTAAARHDGVLTEAERATLGSSVTTDADVVAFGLVAAKLEER